MGEAPRAASFYSAKLCNTVADPDPTIGGQLPDPNDCNSTLTSEARGEMLTPDPNECNLH